MSVVWVRAEVSRQPCLHMVDHVPHALLCMQQAGMGSGVWCCPCSTSLPMLHAYHSGATIGALRGVFTSHAGAALWQHQCVCDLECAASPWASLWAMLPAEGEPVAVCCVAAGMCHVCWLVCHCCSTLAWYGRRQRVCATSEVCGWADMLQEGSWLCCELERLVLVPGSSTYVLRCVARDV